nr:FliM/FliN family flagellar motor switch protein [uncultured Sphingomonas sp.]
MNAQPEPLRNNLRAIDQNRAQLQTTLIGALNRRLIDELQTGARIATERDRRAAIAWIQFRSGEHLVQIAPLLVDGALARVSGAQGSVDAAAAAATLGRIEPLVGALELVLGCELQPAGLHKSYAGDPVLLRLDATTGSGAIQHRLLLAVPPEMAVEPLAEIELAATAIGGLRLRWTARFGAPPIRAARMAAIAPGDLLLLGTGAPVAKLSLPGRNDAPRARIAFNNGVLVLQDDAAMDGSQEASALASADGEPGWADVRIPTTIEIIGAGMTAAELATLGKGSVLPLPANGGTLPVRVIAGEQCVAEGELVAVGDGFGVLVTGVTADGEA